MKYENKIRVLISFEQDAHARYVKAAGREGLTAWVNRVCQEALETSNKKNRGDQ